MNALEKLGYVKHDNPLNDWTDTYAKEIRFSTQSIYINNRFKRAKKILWFDHTEATADYLELTELKAILELMEETE